MLLGWPLLLISVTLTRVRLKFQKFQHYRNTSTCIQHITGNNIQTRMRPLFTHQLLAELLEGPPECSMVGEIGEPVERDDHQRGGLAIHAPVSHGHREVPAQRGERGRALLLRHVAEAAARDERAWGGGVVHQ